MQCVRINGFAAIWSNSHPNPFKIALSWISGFEIDFVSYDFMLHAAQTWING